MDGCGGNIWSLSSVIKARRAVVPSPVAEARSGYGEVAEPQRIGGLEDRGFGLSQPACISGTRPAPGPNWLRWSNQRPLSCCPYVVWQCSDATLLLRYHFKLGSRRG